MQTNHLVVKAAHIQEIKAKLLYLRTVDLEFEGRFLIWGRKWVGSPQTSNLAFLAEFCVVLQMKSTIASPYRLLSMGSYSVCDLYLCERNEEQHWSFVTRIFKEYCPAQTTIVTGLEKNPASTHTISNLQYTIIFHCVPCSKVMSLVSVAAFLRPCISLEWHFNAIRWSWLSCVSAWRAGQCLLSSIWSAVSTRKVQ